MFMILPPATTKEEQDRAKWLERHMIAQEHLQCMGVPCYPQFAGKQQYPHIRCELNQTAMKSLAGNDP